MSHFKAILFRRDRLWLAALVGTVGLSAVTALVFFSQQRLAEAWSTSDTDYANNAVASDTVAIGETGVEILDITLPDPTADTLIHDGAGYAVTAEDTLTDFDGTTERFSDNDHDDAQDYADGAAVFTSADTTITSGEVTTSGTADLTAFGANEKYADADHDDADDDYDGTQLIVNSADSDIAVAEVVTAGTADLTVFDTSEPGLEIFADTTDDNAFDAAGDTGTEDIYRQIHNGADTFTDGSQLEDFSASEQFLDSDRDGVYDDGETILFSADPDLTAGILSGAGTDDVLTAGTAGLTAFSSSLMFYDDNGTDANTFSTGEAIINDADSDGMPTAGDSVSLAGKAGVIAFDATDKIYLDDTNSDGEYTAGETIWFDSADTGLIFNSSVDYVIVGSHSPTITGLSSKLSDLADEAGLAYLDDDNDGLFTSTRNTSAETVVWYGAAGNPSDGDNLATSVTFLDPAQLSDDDINGTWIEDMNAFAASDKYCENGVAGYGAVEAIVSSADSTLDTADTVTITGTCNITTFGATQFFIRTFAEGDGAYADGDDIFERIHDGTDASGDATEVRTMEANDKFADTDNDGAYDDGELIANSADANLAAAEIYVTGTVDIGAFNATFKYSDADNGGTYTDAELIANSADANLDGSEIVLSGTVDTTLFDSSTTPYYKYFDGDTDTAYTDGEDIVTDDDNSTYYSADRVTGIRINNAGTALDADIDNMKFYLENGATPGLQTGVDTLVFTDSDGTYFNSAESFTTDWFVYSNGSSDQRFYVTVDIDAAGGGDGDPTDGATIIATLDSTTGDGNCSTDGEAACAVNLASTTIGLAGSGGDGPEGATTITSAGTITIDSAPPTISAIYTLDGYDTSSSASTCLDTTNIDASSVDGVVDAFCIDFDQSIDDSTIDITDFAIAGETIDSFDTGGTADDDMIVLLVTDGTYATDGIPDVVYTQGTIADSSGNLMATATESTTDAAPPAILSSETIDSDDDGTIDQVMLTFSEGVKVVDGVVGNGFAPITLTASSGTATIDNANYGIGSTTTLTLNVTVSDTDDTGLLIDATYDDDATTVLSICDDGTSDAACDDDYPTANQMIDGETVSGTDGANPIVLSAETTSDNDIAITFSESVTGAAAGDLTTNGGAVNFASVSAASGTTITWQNAVSTTWNTDATGSDVGSGTDSNGDVQSVLPNLTMSAGAVADSSGNPIAVLANDTRTTDGAEAVPLSAEYLDTDADGTVDRVDITFSEDMGITYHTDDWSFPEGGDMNLDDTGASAVDNEIQIDVSADADETGSSVTPTVLYTNNVSRLNDLADVGNASSTFAEALEITDSAAPVELSATYQDSDDDGDVDRLNITTSADPSLTCTYEAGDWTIPVAGSVNLAEGGSTTCTTPSETTIFLSVLTSDANETGGPVNPTVSYSNADVDDSVSDGNGNAMVTWGSALTALDNASPQILSAVYQDSDGDGDVNRVVLTTTSDFGMACTAFTIGDDITVDDAGDFNLTTAGGGSCATNGTSTYTINFTTNGDANETGSDTAVTLTYTQPGNGLEDGAGNDLPTTASVSVSDDAAPVIVARETADTDGDGYLDGVDITLSEAVDDGTFGAGAGGWAVSTYSGEAVGTGDGDEDNMIRIAFTEGGSPDTDALPTIAYTPGTLADAAANTVAASGATITTDEAAPVIVSTDPADGDSGIHQDTSVTITFSEPMDESDVEGAFSMSPDPGESFDWDGTSEVLTVTPAENLTKGETYEITIAASDSSGVGDPNLAETTFDFRIQRSSSSGGGGGGGSAVSTTPVITLTGPTSGSKLKAGSTEDITWSYTGSGIDTIELGYATNGTSFTQIAYNLAKADKTYEWTVPDISSSTVTLKITAYDSGKSVLDTDTISYLKISSASSSDTSSEDTTTSSTEGTTVDSEGRHVAPGSGEMGVSPFDGSTEEISSLQAGWFVRGYSVPAVYYVDADMVRHPFWDTNSFFTWADSWDDVVWVTDATLPTMDFGSAMLPKPGVVLVKIQSDPKVYALDEDSDGNSLLRWVPSEEVAIALYGDSWADYVIDLDPTIFGKYEMGDDMSADDDVDTSIMRTRVYLAELASM